MYVCTYLQILPGNGQDKKGYLSIEPNHLQSQERENGLKDNKQNYMPVVYFTPMDLIK